MIKLSRLTDYAITVLTQMVKDGTGVWAASELADKTGLPAPTVAKVLKNLAKAEIIRAQRGALGGYSLEKVPAAISVATIIEAMDGPIALTDCAEGGDHSCTVERICPMSGNWDRVNKAVRRALDEVSLEDMAVGHHPPRFPNDPLLVAASE